MQNHIEFHDSTLLAIDSDGQSVRITLDAYVHRWEQVDGTWKGTGLSQLVRVVLQDAALPPSPNLPGDIYAGEVRAGGESHDNVVSLPFASFQASRLRLELQSREVVIVNGSSITVEPIAQARFVEELSNKDGPLAC